MTQVSKEAYFNPYMIDKYNVNDIVFYRDGEVVALTNKGWIELGGHAASIAEIDAMHFERAVKLNLTRNDHFFIKTGDGLMAPEAALYINLDAAPEIVIEPLGEEVAMKESLRTYYGEFFNITATFNGERKTLKVMKGHYTRSVPTPLGEKAKKLESLMDELGINVSERDTEKMINSFDRIIEVVKD